MTKVIIGKSTRPQNEHHIYPSSAQGDQGWCVLLLRHLFSNNTLKTLLPSLCLLLLVIFSLGNRLYNFVAGIFIPQYHFPFAVALSLGQALISLLFLRLLHLSGAVPLQSYSRALGERLFVASICSSTYSVLSMWSTAHSSFSGLFPLVMPLLPLLTVGLSSLLKLASPLSPHISVLISFISGMSLVLSVSHGVFCLDPLEYIYAPLALLLLGVSLVWLAKVSEAEHCRSPNAKASVFDIFYCHLVNQSVLLGLLWTLHPDNPWRVLSGGSWHSLLFHGYLLALLLLGMALNFLVALAALSFSPLAAAVLHSVYPLVLPYLQIL